PPRLGSGMQRGAAQADCDSARGANPARKCRLVCMRDSLFPSFSWSAYYPTRETRDQAIAIMSGGGRTTRASHRIVANPRPSRSRDNREIACPSENEIYVAALLKSRLQKRISHRQRL